jgi:hypothetical protein
MVPVPYWLVYGDAHVNMHAVCIFRQILEYLYSIVKFIVIIMDIREYRRGSCRQHKYSAIALVGLQTRKATY